MALALFASLTSASLLRRAGLRLSSASSSSSSMKHARHLAPASLAGSSPLASTPTPAPSPSLRIERTDSSVIGAIGDLMRAQKEPVLSLAQGIVHWGPPQSAIDAASAALASGDSAVHAYGPAHGDPALRAALYEKLATENGIHRSEVMVTTGANQAFANLAVALVDAGDKVVLFKPYYFNHLMAIQMTGGADHVVIGETDANLIPDMTWLQKQFDAQQQNESSSANEGSIKLVVIVNPGNPSGTIVPKPILEEAAAMCAKHDAWLVVDNTYEYFVYNDEADSDVGAKTHECIEDSHVVNIFSFSKAYGLMGWRVGFLTYPPTLNTSLVKAHDTIAICNSRLSQRVALGALTGAGKAWCTERIASLKSNRNKMKAAISAALGPDSLIGCADGAIYMMVQLPHTREKTFADDDACMRFLIEKHGVAVLPASSCGYPGAIRVCYANLDGDRFDEALRRLEAGLKAWAAKP